ncbi:MAG: hypothetical protein P1S60_16450 [Anaerolineae bacterium]|nr:hypothetical protein [Anaerolineae bacterium]
MEKLYKPALIIHIIISVILGTLLLIVPGRYLTWLGWAPIDPIISRILGAALLALAWGGVRMWRGGTEPEVKLLLEIELAFAGLAAIGVLRHLVVARWPFIVWLLFIVLAIFALIWLGVLLQKRH